jgi:serine/threonine protein kinase
MNGSQPLHLECDDAICNRFQKAWITQGPQSIQSFLQDKNDPKYLGTLCILVEITLGFRWERYQEDRCQGAVENLTMPSPVSEYLRQFPELAADAKAVSRLSQSEEELRARYSGAKDKGAEAPSENSPNLPRGYKFVERLGEGAMGVVYKAEQERCKRFVALKMIKQNVLASQEAVARFQREVRAMASCTHQNIVPVYDVNDYEGQLYYSMEFVAGGDMGQLTKVRQLPRVAARLVKQLAKGMSVAHEKGVVHRDLKPENVLLKQPEEDQTGKRKWLLHVGENDWRRVATITAMIMDFGQGKFLNDSPELTGQGVVLGTPAYMAPELADGQASSAGATADVYSLGAILYHLLTAQPPFDGKTFGEIREQLKEREADFPVDVPIDLAGICMKCLEKKPTERYSTAAELANALNEYLLRTSKPPRHTPLSRPGSTGGRAQVQEQHHDCTALQERVTSCLQNSDNETRLAKDLLLGSIINDAKEQVANLANNEYFRDLGSRLSYLVPTTHLFRKARGAWVTSLDTRSTWWRRALRHKVGKRYLRAQSKDTVRLFVFSSQASVRSYVDVLNAHYTQYGDTGRVLICSLVDYRHFLERVMQQAMSRDGLLRNDFAILRYKEKNSDVTRTVKVLLSGNRWAARALREKDFDYEDYTKFITELGKVSANMKVGQAKLESGAQLRCVRWGRNLNDDGNFVGFLNDMFNRQGDR